METGNLQTYTDLSLLANSFLYTLLLLRGEYSLRSHQGSVNINIYPCLTTVAGNELLQGLLSEKSLTSAKEPTNPSLF